MDIALVPADRKTEGLLLRRSVRENIALASLRNFSRWGVIGGAGAGARSRARSSRLHIVTSGLRQPVGRLSGGNQQKAVIAKWLLSDSEIFLLYDITRGVDIGAKAEIYRIVLALAERGAAILYYSTDLDELLRLCHRVAVFHDGSVATTLEKGELTDTALGERGVRPERGMSVGGIAAARRSTTLGRMRASIDSRSIIATLVPIVVLAIELAYYFDRSPSSFAGSTSSGISTPRCR